MKRKLENLECMPSDQDIQEKIDNVLHTILTEGQIYIDDQRLTTPLQYAATLADEELARGIIIHLIRDKNSQALRDFLNPITLDKTPLDLAIIFGRTKTVDLLLTLGARAEYYSFSLAISNHPSSLQMMQSIINSGFESIWFSLDHARRTSEPHFQLVLNNMSGPKYMWNCLMFAQYEGDFKSIRELFKRGAMCFAKQSLEHAILDFSSLDKFVKLLQIFKEFNVNVNCGQPLLLAFTERRFRMALLLLAHGANPNTLYSVKGTGDMNDNWYDDEEYGIYRQTRLQLKQQPDDYTVWLERRFNLRGLNRLLVAYGLDVRKLCTVEEKHIFPGHKVTDDEDEDDRGCELRSWMVSRRTVLSLLELSCTSLPSSDYKVLSTFALPICVGEYVVGKTLKKLDPLSIVNINSKYEC